MPDLVIGGRRAAVQRPWRAGAIAVAMLGVALVVAWFIYRRSVAYDMPGGEAHGEISSSQTAPGSPPTLVYNGSSLTWAGGIAVLRVTGDAHAIGAAHGRFLAPYLPATLSAALPSIENSVGPGGMFGRRTHTMRLAWQWRFVDDGLVESDRRLVAGMTRGAAASGVTLPYKDLVREQAVLDIGVPSPRSPEAEQHGLARSLTVIAAQQDAPARIWIGHTLALPGIDDGGDSERLVLTIAHPEGHIAYASVGWPGELGVLAGVNANGIALMVHPLRTDDVRITRTARPVAHLARAVLESATTLDEAVKLVESTPTLGAATILVANGTGQWLVIERTPSKSIVERKPKLPVLGDVLTTNALASDPENDRARRMLPTMTKLDRAAHLVRAPLIDAAAMAAVLRDRHAVDDTSRARGHRGVIDDGRAVMSIILDPTSLELWIADPRAAGRYRGFDLRHELRAEGDHPAPPADIAADPLADPDEESQLAAARADLRVARAALVSGNRVAAAEACARARVRAPALPEALVLDAQISQTRGDLTRARALFQQWLDGGPDDPWVEERARSVLSR